MGSGEFREGKRYHGRVERRGWVGGLYIGMYGALEGLEHGSVY